MNYLAEELHTSPDGEGRGGGPTRSAGDEVPNTGSRWKEKPARDHTRGNRGKPCG